MQKKYLFIFFIVITALIFCFGFSGKLFAQNASSTTEINAEILSNVWYSTTIINEGDNIIIYAGFQNHSGKSLSGNAGFFVDDLQISKVPFTALPKSLIKLETPYLAIKGNHTTQVKILDIGNLLASETEKASLAVKYQVTTSDILNTAGDVVNNVTNVVNNYADNLANYVESLKQPVTDVTTQNTDSSTTKTPAQIAQEKLTGKVLGVSTENLGSTTTSGQKTATNWGIYFYNMFLDALAFIIRHWIWTLVIIVIFVVYLTLR